MRTIKTWLATIAVLLCSISASAYDIEVDGIYYEIYSSSKTAEVTYKVRRANNYSGSITIPETITKDGVSYNVTSIGYDAFYGCTDLTSITLHDGISNIGGSAFMNCTGLTSISIPNAITSIEPETFRNCRGLTSILIPKGVTSIGNYAFYDCHNLRVVINCSSLDIQRGQENGWIAAYARTVINNVDGVVDDLVFTENNGQYYLSAYLGGDSVLNLPENYKGRGYGIGESVFKACLGLTSITIPDGVTSIGNSAFSGCSGLTSITLPNSLMSIGTNAFSGCYGLTSIVVAQDNPKYDSRNNSNAIIETASNTLLYGCKNTIIPNGVTSIGEDAFYACSGLTSITIPNSVTSIGEEAFRDCYDLTSVTLSDNVKSLGDYAFYQCYDLASINFPNSITSIGSEAFYCCEGLSSVVLPNSVTSIGEQAFYCCSGLSSISVAQDNPKYDSRDNSNAIIETESNTLLYGCKNTIIPHGVTSIGKDAFYACSGLTSITLPNSVMSIGEAAFNGCSGLTSIVLPNSVTSIESYAFYNCSGMTSITLPDSLTIIRDATFYGCSGLKSIVLPNKVTSIESYAFYKCSNITSVVIPCNVMSIGGAAFADCRGLEIVECHAVTPPSLVVAPSWSYQIDSFRDVDKTTCKLKVPEESISAYQQAEGWKEFLNIESLTTGISSIKQEIGKNALVYNLNGTRVKNTKNMPKGVYIINGKKVMVK